MKHTNHPKKAIRVVFALMLSVSMILGLTMTTAGAAGFQVSEDLETLSRHVAGIQEITDAKKLDTANLTGDTAVNSQSLVRWARSLLGKSPDLTIKKEKTVTGGTYGDVIIDAAVGNGTVTLDGVTIEGQLLVQGGGSHSIKVQNCDVETVVLDKDTSTGEAPRLELTGTEVESVEVKQPAIIEANSVSGKNAIGEVKAEANVTVQGAATSIGTVTVPEKAAENVKLTVNDAKVAEVKAEAPVTIEANETAAKIENVEAKANVTVAGKNTKIDTITVPKNVEKAPEINVSAGSVNTVEANSKAKVSGAENAIANVEAAAPVEVNSTAVTKVTVTVNVTVTVSGDGQIEVKVDTASDVEIKATSTQNLSVSTTQTVTSNITVKQGEETQAVHIHKWVEIGRTDATCTVPGSILYTCTEPNCDAADHQKTEIIPAKGHTEVLIPAVAPTCTVAGTTAGKKCAVCNADIVQPQQVDALGHDWLSGYQSDETGHWHVCSRCDEIKDKTTHTYNTEVCTEAAKCTVCGYQKAAGTHTWDAGVEQTAPTCTAAGSVKYTCTSCSATKTEPVPALGHIYGAPTYQWGGTSCTATRVCTRTGCDHVDSETVEGTASVLKPSTCTEQGFTMYTAKFKNAAFTVQTTQLKTERISHILEHIAAVAATYESAGNNEYWVCTSCGQAFTDAAGTHTTTPAEQAIPAIHFMEVGGTRYGSFEAARAAARNAGLQDKQLGEITYRIYPTIEIYGDCELNDLTLAAGESITVKNGGSLTVTGTLTLGESTMEGWMIDAGMLNLEQGSSFKLGNVQYTGTNGAFAVNDAGSRIELTGKAKDMEGNNKVAMLFGNITLQNAFTLDSSYTFINDSGSVLTVKAALTNEAYLENRSEIRIAGGTLINKATIDNESGVAKAMGVTGQINILSGGNLTNEAKANINGGSIDAFGSTVTNAGTIQIGDNCALVIENGSTLNNTGSISGGEGSEINIGDYIYANSTVTNTVTGAPKEYTKRVAAVFDSTKLQSALNNYDYVIPCGTATTGTNTVTLSDLTVPTGKILILKETVNDGTNKYHNQFTLDGTMTLNGQMVTVGNPAVTVNGRIDAYDFLAFDTLTIADGGYVYAEKEMMIVSTALNVSESGTLEIGSGCGLDYQGEQPAVISGTLMNTVRYMNGLAESNIFAQSHIEGDVTPTATLTTLVITEDTVLRGNYTVDTVIPIQYQNDKGETVVPTLRVGANSSLKFKTLYTGEGGTAEQIIGLTGADGSYTVSPDENGNVTATNTDAFLNALDNPNVTDITITDDITLTYADAIYDHPIRKAVTVAAGKTLEVKPFDPAEDDEAEFNMMFNCMIIAENGSLTLEDGAVLKTSCHFSGENEPWHLYRGQVNVEGGALYAANGKLETYNDNFGNIYLEYGSGDLTLPDSCENINVTFGVDRASELYAANEDTRCNSLLLKCSATLTDDLALNKDLSVDSGEYGPHSIRILSNATLTVPEGVTFYADGPVTVYGKLVNLGTIQGEGVIDVMGGRLENGGTIDLYGEGSDLAVEKGGVLNNYVGEYDEAKTSGIITKNTPIDFCDYWYNDAEPVYCSWNVLEGDTTLDGMGENITVIAAAFSPQQVQAALAATTTWGEGDQQQTAHKYMVVMASGTAEEDGVVTLEGITVNSYQTLMLKDYVDVGNKTYHNAVYNLSGITFGEKAGMMIMGDPTVNVTGTLDYSRVRVNGNPTINAPGFVHNAEELKAALANGGDIYLTALASKTDVYMDGEWSQENQYHITTTEISTNTNLISMTNEPLAVFFDDGFTVATDTNLRFDGLNVVAAADSTVNGRVEAHNGILVVQANSEKGATLTIGNTGTVVIGGENEWAALAIFDTEKLNKIVNNGTIENFGDFGIDWENENQFEGNKPLEYVKFRDLVCDLYRDFGNLPGLEPIDFETENEWGVKDLHWVYAYPDGGNEFFNEENPADSDYDAIAAFSWLIKNGIIPECSEKNPELRPWHYVTRDEVGELFTAFAQKVLNDDTVTVNIIGGNYICRTNTIEITEQDGNKRYISEKDQCFDTLREALSALRSVDVNSEEDFLNALDTPYVEEIHVTGDITLYGCYYKDGERVASENETDDKQLSVYLWAAGEWQDQWREIFVEPGVTLTLAEGVKMDIRQSVELCLCDGENGSNGKLVLESGSGLNVFGGLKPDNWNEEFGDGDDRQRKYVIEEEGSYINFYPDVMEFAKRLWERIGDRVDDATEEEIASYTSLANEWPGDGDDRVPYFAALVKYDTYQPREEGDENDFRMVWRPYDKICYGEAMTVLGNLYKAITTETLPDTFGLDGDWEDDWCISDYDLEQLLNAFTAALPRQDDNTAEFVVRRHDGSDDHTDGMIISGKNFTQPVTITCDPRYLNDDDFGGDIKFQNCAFTQGVTVQLAAGVGYNIRLENCTGAFTVTAADNVKDVERTGVNFFGDLSGVTVNGLTIGGTAGWQDEEYGINVRYDACGGEQKSYISTVEVTNHQEDKTVTVSGSGYAGKLRIGGNIDISGVTMAEPGFIELCNEPWRANIVLGSNRITVNDDCGGEYSFTGSGKVYVPNQNGSARITVNGVDLGTPHIFGDGDFGIFFPVSSDTNITFTVEQGQWDDESQCVPENGWTTLQYAPQYKEDGGCNLGGCENQNWITDPYQVRVTVKIPNVCTVVYDTLWWKPIQINEFVDLLNWELETNYDLTSLGLDHNDYLTFGTAKTILTYVWTQYPGEGQLDLPSLINDENYWNELQRWNDNTDDPNKNDWNPDNWTRTWNDAHDMVDRLKEALNISDNTSGGPTPSEGSWSEPVTD